MAAASSSLLAAGIWLRSKAMEAMERELELEAIPGGRRGRLISVKWRGATKIFGVGLLWPALLLAATHSNCNPSLAHQLFIYLCVHLAGRDNV